MRIFQETYRGIRPDDPHGRMGLCNPERGFRTEMYFSAIPGEIAGMCSCHQKQLKLDGRSETPIFQNIEISGVPHLIRGNRLDGGEFSHSQWMDELDYFRYDGISVMQGYCFLQKYSNTKSLPSEKLEDIEIFFLKLRESGVKVLLRFAYELSPLLTGPTAEIILSHLTQLKDLLKQYVDVIYCLQCGFIGKFGEWHHSFHHLQDDLVFHKELLSAVLESLPQQRKTMMRYPSYKINLFGTKPLMASEAFTLLPQARIGHFNDGFLANSSSHGGTFSRANSLLNIEELYEYVAAESTFLPQDGELFWRDLGGAALPTEAVPLLAKWHYDTFGFVHGNQLFEGVNGYSIDIWKRVPVDPMFLMEQNLPFSSDYFTDAAGRHIWRSYYEYIRDHLGYRLELQNVDLQIGERITGKIQLVNRGFSAMVNPRPCYLVLGDCKIKLDCEVQKWYSNEVQTLVVDKLTPEFHGNQVGLWLPDESAVLQNDSRYAVRFANPLRFENGINELGVLRES